MQKYNILELNEKLLPELQTIAEELGIKKVRSFKKEELVYKILDEQAISYAGIQAEKEKVKEDKWVIDGTYRSTLEKRLKESDLVIYLDYSTFAQIRGILKRYIMLYGKERKEIPGCNEKIDFKFLIWVFRWRRNKRKPTCSQYRKNYIISCISS